MEWKVGDRVKWVAPGVRPFGATGEIVAISPAYLVCVHWESGSSIWYNQDDPSFIHDVALVIPEPAGDDVKVVLSLSPPELSDLDKPKEPPPAPVEPRPCQRHYYGFKNESCTCANRLYQ